MESEIQFPVRHSWQGILCSIFISLGFIMYLITSCIKNWGDWTPWTILEIIIKCTLVIFIIMCAEEMILNGSKYRIKDHNLFIGTRFWWSLTTIPVQSIRYIECLARPKTGRVIRIAYNKFDDVYLDPKDVDGLINCLTTMNPDIEVRQET